MITSPEKIYDEMVKHHKNWIEKYFINIEKGMKEVDYVRTCNLMTRRKLFVEVGGFDTSFKRAEDFELCYRIRKKRYKVVMNFKSRIIHKPAKRNSNEIMQNWYDELCARIRFQIKHFGFFNTNILVLNYPPLSKIFFKKFWYFITNSEKDIYVKRITENASTLTKIRYLLLYPKAVVITLIQTIPIILSRNKNFLKAL